MRDAFRSHYQPACDELIPGADPYIAGLVARCGRASDPGDVASHSPHRGQASQWSGQGQRSPTKRDSAIGTHSR